MDDIIADVEHTFAEFPQERARLGDMGAVAKVGGALDTGAGSQVWAGPDVKTVTVFSHTPVCPRPFWPRPQACRCPLYWKAPLFYAAGGERTGSVSVHKFIAMWRK